MHRVAQDITNQVAHALEKCNREKEVGESRRLFYENVKLRDELAALRLDSENEVKAAQAALGGVEIKLEAAESDLHRVRRETDDQVASERNLRCAAERGEQTAKEEQRMLQDRVQELERYLKQVPTAEEFLQLKREAKILHQKKTRYREKASAQTKRADTAESSLFKVRADLQDANERERILQSHVDSLNARDKFAVAGFGERRVCRDLIEDLKMEAAQSSAEATQARDRMDMWRSRCRLAEERLVQETESFTKRLEEKDVQITELEDIRRLRQEEVGELRSRLCNISKEKQELYEQIAVESDCARRYRALVSEHGSVDLLGQVCAGQVRVGHAVRQLVEFCAQCIDQENYKQDAEVPAFHDIKSVEEVTPTDEREVELAEILSREKLQGLLKDIEIMEDEVDLLHQRAKQLYAEQCSEKLNCSIM